MSTIDKEPVGSVVVIGGGITGIQASIDIADSGFKVYLVENTPSIGGKMAQLDKTFPTQDCSICILGPLINFASQHENIELMTYHELEKVEGKVLDFTVTLRKKESGINQELCNGCGECFEVCPIQIPSEFEAELGTRNAIYKPYPQAVPNIATIDKDHCIDCGFCELRCEKNAILKDDRDELVEVKAGSIVVTTGFEKIDPLVMAEYGYGIFPDVVTNLQLERLMSASGPTRGQIVNSRGKHVKKLGFIQCVGSRDVRYCSYCSKICCMASVKEAVVAKEHDPDIESSIFYMDIRSYGKGFHELVERSRLEHGVKFYQGRAAEVNEIIKTGKLEIRHEITKTGEILKTPVDLVVLATAMKPPTANQKLATILGVQLNENGFFKEIQPLETTKSGIFVAGVARGPDDIPDCVIQASGVAGKVGTLLWQARYTQTAIKEKPPPLPFDTDQPRIGVFICDCGSNIAGFIDTKAVTEYAKDLENVVIVDNNKYTCSAPALAIIKESILKYELTRVVVASCTPRTHEPLFRRTCEEMGLNPFLFEMANLREHDSWVHMKSPEEGTEKAKDLVRMSVARASLLKPLDIATVPVKKTALVIGGGPAGLVAANGIAEQNFKVHLVEKENEFGGALSKKKVLYYFPTKAQFSRVLFGKRTTTSITTLSESTPILRSFLHPILKSQNITKYLSSRVTNISGYPGNFDVEVEQSIKSLGGMMTNYYRFKVGTIIVATGYREYNPEEYLDFGKDRKVITLMELEDLLKREPDTAKRLKSVVFVQCAHSKDEDHPYCSRLCCAEAIKNAVFLKESNRHLDVFIIHRGLNSFGEIEDFYRESRLVHGVYYFQYSPSRLPEFKIKDGKKRLIVFDQVTKMELSLDPDLVVLSPPRVPSSGTRSLRKLLKVPAHTTGFYLELHPKLRPLEFATAGIFMAGACHWPKELDHVIYQAYGAAAKAVNILSKDYLESEGITCEIDVESCIGCGRCVDSCAFGAITLEEAEQTGNSVAVVNEILCKGCGCCVSACPNGAVSLRHFETSQILEMIDALVKP
ncbi:MAG: FAD-dependent oxidoreductase [Candidatus Hodarchaeales archaeon]|jgi:heterodisulfide reductase subunit A